jgi:hypothetical protein
MSQFIVNIVYRERQYSQKAKVICLKCFLVEAIDIDHLLFLLSVWLSIYLS